MNEFIYFFCMKIIIYKQILRIKLINIKNNAAIYTSFKELYSNYICPCMNLYFSTKTTTMDYFFSLIWTLLTAKYKNINTKKKKERKFKAKKNCRIDIYEIKLESVCVCVGLWIKKKLFKLNYKTLASGYSNTHV